MTQEPVQKVTEQRGVEAEAIEDAAGRVLSLRFYVDGRAFLLDLTRLDGDEACVEITACETLERETPEERLGRVSGIVDGFLDRLPDAAVEGG